PHPRSVRGFFMHICSAGKLARGTCVERAKANTGFVRGTSACTRDYEPVGHHGGARMRTESHCRRGMFPRACPPPVRAAALLAGALSARFAPGQSVAPPVYSSSPG